MSSYSTAFRVGIFTLLGLCALSLILWMLKAQLFMTQHNVFYYTLTSNARGVTTRTNVRTNGVDVGYVSDIKIQGELTKIQFKIQQSIQIPEGSRIELRTRGLLGETFLEIIRSSDQGRYIEDGLIPMNEGYVDITDFIGIMGQVVEDVKILTSSLSEAVHSGDTKQENRIIALYQDVEQTLNQIQKMIADNSTQIAKTTKNIAKITENLAEYTQEDPFASIKYAAKQLNTSLTHINSVTQNIQEGRGTLGKLIQDDSLFDDVHTATRSLKNMISPATNLNIQIQYRNELRFDQSSQHFFGTQLQFRPERFYVLGITQYPTSLERSVITTEENIQGESTVVQSEAVIESTEPSLRFNAQFGHRFHQFALRFGLFENTGGWGIDYHLLKDRIKLSFENYQWGTNKERSFSRFKLYGFWYIFPQIYATFGISDITRKATTDDTSSWIAMRPFLGAGFYFNDDDLKNMLGIASLAF